MRRWRRQGWPSGQRISCARGATTRRRMRAFRCKGVQWGRVRSGIRSGEVLRAVCAGKHSLQGAGQGSWDGRSS